MDLEMNLHQGLSHGPVRTINRDEDVSSLLEELQPASHHHAARRNSAANDPDLNSV